MAQRRCLHALARRSTAFLFSGSASLKTLPSLSNSVFTESTFASKSPLTTSLSSWSHHYPHHFSSSSRDDSDNDDDDDDDDEEVDGDVSDVEVTASGLSREYSAEERESEAAAIGYKVIGPLQQCDRVFKSYERVYAVIQIGSHQFKVSIGDCVFTERLKFCQVNDKLNLNKVLLLGSTSQTVVGRPTVPEAAVHAVVEEHALDAKVIIFKKKRRKNYRRTKGHRQELTKLRITDIQGIEKPTITKDGPKFKKVDVKQQENVAVAA